MQIYDLYTEDPAGAVDTSLETGELAEIDQKGSLAFDRILDDEDGSEETRRALAQFLAATIIRVPSTLERFTDLAQLLLLELVEIVAASDYTTFRASTSYKFPEFDISEAEFDYLRSLPRT